MEKISIILAVINILVIAGPIASMVAVHVDNPIEVIIPPEAQELNKTLGSLSETLQTIELVNVTYFSEIHVLILTFSITNKLNTNLEVNNIEADVVCVGHNYPLGHAYLSDPVRLEPGRKSYLVINSQWTADAEHHIEDQHTGESAIDINLVNFTVDVEGVVVQVSQPITLRNVPISLPGG